VYITTYLTAFLRRSFDPHHKIKKTRGIIVTSKQKKKTKISCAVKAAIIKNSKLIKHKSNSLTFLTTSTLSIIQLGNSIVVKPTNQTEIPSMPKINGLKLYLTNHSVENPQTNPEDLG
jgi:hypothetical protein